eukprot:gene28301-46047_t
MRAGAAAAPLRRSGRAGARCADRWRGGVEAVAAVAAHIVPVPLQPSSFLS